MKQNEIPSRAFQDNENNGNYSTIAQVNIWSKNEIKYQSNRELLSNHVCISFAIYLLEIRKKTKN